MSDVRGIPDEVLSKLICYECNQYLSIFPISTHPQRGSVCGRCITDTKDGFVSNYIYEMSVSYQKFPCCNDKKGCLEYMIPSELRQHEQRCYYNVIKCPLQANNSCTWVGARADISEHFETDHPTKILRTDAFEVDILNDHTDSFIYTNIDEEFLLQTSSQNNEFYFKLDLLEARDFNNVWYEIKLSTTNKGKEICDTKHLGDTYTIPIGKITKMLNNPTNIIAHFKILKKYFEDADKDKSTVNQNQLKMLECPVCLEYMVPPIFQCKTGHSICQTCLNLLKEGPNQCPSCKSEFQDTRNFLVEELVERMTYFCKFDECPFQGKPALVKAHQKSCVFGPFHCPLSEYDPCSTIFSYNDLYRHIKKHHYEFLLEMDIVSIPFDAEIQENISDCFIIPHGPLLFKMCFLYEFNERTFKWSVHLLGNPGYDVIYKYHIDFNDPKTNNRFYIKKNCDINNSQPFQYDGAVILKYDQISEFIKDQVCFRTRITTD